jgi:hypothetical protein
MSEKYISSLGKQNTPKVEKTATEKQAELLNIKIKTLESSIKSCEDEIKKLELIEKLEIAYGDLEKSNILDTKVVQNVTKTVVETKKINKLDKAKLKLGGLVMAGMAATGLGFDVAGNLLSKSNGSEGQVTTENVEQSKEAVYTPEQIDMATKEAEIKVEALYQKAKNEFVVEFNTAAPALDFDHKNFLIMESIKLANFNNPDWSEDEKASKSQGIVTKYGEIKRIYSFIFGEALFIMNKAESEGGDGYAAAAKYLEENIREELSFYPKDIPNAVNMVAISGGDVDIAFANLVKGSQNGAFTVGFDTEKSPLDVNDFVGIEIVQKYIIDKTSIEEELSSKYLNNEAKRFAPESKYLENESDNLQEIDSDINNEAESTIDAVQNNPVILEKANESNEMDVVDKPIYSIPNTTEVYVYSDSEAETEALEGGGALGLEEDFE